MKNFKLLVVSLLTMIALVSCDMEQESSGSSKASVEGTWRNVTVVKDDLTITPAANDQEGTWVKVEKVYPTVPSTSTTEAGVTTTTHGINDTQTTTTTTEVVINASGSYVKTETIVVSWTARTVTANTATSTHVGLTAISAGSTTKVTTDTVTVTVDGAAYKEEKVTTVAWSKTGLNKDGTTITLANNTSTPSTTAYVTSAGSLKYNSAASEGTGFTKTVDGNTVAAPANLASTKTTTTTITFKSDGTYTKEEIIVTDKPAVTAIAATANSAEQVATAAGTSTKTTNVTGVYETTIKSYDNTLLMTPGYYDEVLDLYTREDTVTVSQIGTGSLISQNYPATAYTSSDYTTSTKSIDVVVGDKAIILGFDGTNGDLYSEYTAE